MKVDIGFWDINGNYIPDIQELNEIERKEIMETKNFNEFFDELNDMANFKNFGESKEEEITNADGSRNWEANILLDNVKRLKQENTELKAENERLKEEITKLKYYLNKIREDELYGMDIEWDEYITQCTSTEYTNIINFVELALGERDE